MDEKNPFKIIQNLYTVIGKMHIKIDAYEAIIRQYKLQIEALQKELKKNDTCSNEESS